MKHVLKTTLLLLAITLSNIAKSESIIIDVYESIEDIYLSAGSNPLSFTHDLNAHGFNAGLDKINSISLTLNLFDDGDTDENTVSSGTRSAWYTECGLFSCWRVYTGETYTYWFISSYGQLEKLDVVADGNNLGNHEVNYSPLLFENIDFNELETDGQLQISLVPTNGDFLFRSSTLSVLYDKVSPVPEPAALPLMLLGLGMVGLAYRKRKTATNSAEMSA